MIAITPETDESNLAPGDLSEVADLLTEEKIGPRDGAGKTVVVAMSGGVDSAVTALVMRERGSRTRQLLEQRAREESVALSYAVEAEGREAVRAIVATGGGIGFVSAAEFGADDPRLVRIPLDGPPLLMHEKLICLHERRNSKAIQAFFALARSLR